MRKRPHDCVLLRLSGSMLLVLVAGGIPLAPTLAQAVKGAPREGAPPPPLTYRGLPGVSSVDEGRAKLGEPVHEARW